LVLTGMVLGVRQVEAVAKGGASVWGSRLTRFETAFICGVGVLTGATVWVIVDLPNCPSVEVGWCGWAESYCGGGRHELMVSSWCKMRFIPSMSASNISTRLHKDLDCLVCLTRRLVDCSKKVLIMVSALWTRTSIGAMVASGCQLYECQGG